ncbi:MAG: Hint domain-containing protein [Pseudomonadota bacterium]
MFGWTTKTAPRYMADTSAACDGAALRTRGLLAGSHVATAMGWRSVEALAPGDLVLTFDHGLRPVADVQRETFWVADMMAPAAYASVMVPAGALGNAKDLELLPDQGVLIESDAACDAYGDPFAVIPAKALEGYRGITRSARKTRVEVITLVFDTAQVIYVQGGTLVHCPPAEIRVSDLGQVREAYDVIPADEASFLVECMMIEDQDSVAA